MRSGLGLARDNTKATVTDAVTTAPNLRIGPGAKPARPVVFNQPMLSLEEISDRLEIQQLLVDYSTAIDQGRFDDLDQVFTQHAYIDY